MLDAVHDAHDQLDIIDDLRAADDGDLRRSRQQRSQVFGHVHPVVEVRVDERGRDRVAGALKGKDRQATSARGLDRPGRLEGIEHIQDQAVHPGLDPALDGPVLALNPVGSAHVDGQRTQLDPRLPQTVGQAVGQGVETWMRPIFHHVDVEYAHGLRVQPTAASNRPAPTTAARCRYSPE